MRPLVVAAFALTLSACNCGPGLANARPELEVDPTSLDFGSVSPGATSEKQVNVVSRGSSPVSISSITIMGDAAFFVPPMLPRDLAAGETLTLTISYSPRSSGSHAARLVVSSNAVNAPELLVPLVGDARTGCVPNTCGAQQCGQLDDGCGGQLECGSCSGGLICGGGGTPNVCGCVPEAVAAMCTRLGANCGTLTASDSCGVTRTVSCGSCTGIESCGGGGTANVCGCSPETDAAMCTRLTASCGMITASDSCGTTRTVSCGDCTLPATCGGGGTPNVCACGAETDAAFCARLNTACGPLTAPDACGQSRTVNCGTCSAPATCGGGGTPGACGCGETDQAFCSRLQKNCGMVTGTDVCGAARTANCGSCTVPGQFCGGGGTANVCGCGETDQEFCSRLQKNCGTVADTDRCGMPRTAECGTCTSPASCDATNVCSCAAETNQAFCARLTASCGNITNTDNCGTTRTVDCGVCGSCSSPGTIPALGHVVSGTTSGSSGMSNTCGGGGAPEQVWSYTPQTSGPVTISSCGSSFDTVLSVLGGTCPGGSQVTCNDNTTTWCSNGTTHSYVTFNATAGTQYFVVVDGAGSGNGWYNLRVAPPDGTCANPVNVPSNGGTLRLGMNGNSTNSGSCGGSGGDKVHRWVAPRSGTATVTMVPDFWPSTLYVRSGSCTGTELACDNKTQQWPTNTISFPVTAGGTYFIWASYGTYNGPVVSIYDLTISLP